MMKDLGVVYFFVIPAILVVLGILMALDPVRFARLFYWIAGKPRITDLPRRWRPAEIWCEPEALRRSPAMKRRLRLLGLGFVTWGTLFLILLARRPPKF